MGTGQNGDGVEKHNNDNSTAPFKTGGKQICCVYINDCISMSCLSGFTTALTTSLTTEGHQYHR